MGFAVRCPMKLKHMALSLLQTFQDAAWHERPVDDVASTDSAFWGEVSWLRFVSGRT